MLEYFTILLLNTDWNIHTFWDKKVLLFIYNELK